MRRQPLWFLVSVLAVSAAQGATPLYVTPDVPTTPAGALLGACTGGTAMLPWEIYRYTTGPPAYSCAFSVPGSPHLDAIHKLDSPGDWLFSVGAASNLGGSLLPAGSDAEARDVVRFEAGAATFTICLAGASVGIPPGSNVDALYMEGGDTGNMIISFDVPTTIPPFPVFEPADLVRLVPTGAGMCPGWALAAANPAFDASTAGAGIPISSNVDGAARYAGRFDLSLNVPTDLAPPVQPTSVPGQIVATDTLTFSLFEALGGWPMSARVDGLSLLANPGMVPPTITVTKAAAPAGDLIISWSASCSEGGEDYGIYEGVIGTWYGHTLKDCSDAGSNLQEQITPGAGGRYYLLVPRNNLAEGSYGKCSAGYCLGGDERPVGTAVCSAPQILTPCPPP